MSATKPQLVTVTMEEARLLRAPQTDAPSRLIEVIKMTAQKALTPSLTVSPAVIALFITLIIQTVGIVWWAASISKDNESNAKKIEELKSDVATQKVYIDTTREKFIKMETLVSTMQSESQLKQLLQNEKEKERK